MEITVNEIIEYAKNGKLDNPQILSDYLVRLSAFIWHAGQATLNAEIEYAKKWREIRRVATSDKQADNEIKIEKEWREWQEAKLGEKVIIQTIQAFKKRLRSMEDEFKNF